MDGALIRREERHWSVAEKKPRTCWNEPRSLHPRPKVWPAAKRLLLNGVGAGIMEREATKSRCPRLGPVSIVRAGEKRKRACFHRSLLTASQRTTVTFPTIIAVSPSTPTFRVHPLSTIYLRTTVRLCRPQTRPLNAAVCLYNHCKQ